MTCRAVRNLFTALFDPLRARCAKLPTTVVALIMLAAGAAFFPQAAEAQLSTYTYTGSAFSVSACTAIYTSLPCVNGNITGTVTFSGVPSGYTGSLAALTGASIVSYSFTANGVGFSLTSDTPVLCGGLSGFTFSSGSITAWNVNIYTNSTTCSSRTAILVSVGTASSSGGDDGTSNYPYLVGLNSSQGTWSLTPSAPQPTPDKTLGAASSRVGGCHCGDPIDVSTGNVFEKVVDYTTTGQNPLAFIRYYNSMAIATGVNPLASTLGTNWRSNFDRYLNIVSSTEMLAERPDGQILTFTQSGSTWASDTDVDVTLAPSGSNWVLTDHDNTVETYVPVTGPLGFYPTLTFVQLSTIQARNGYTQTMHYNSSNQLTSVTDSYGRTLTFTYSSGLLSTVATQDTFSLGYSYTAAGGSNVLTMVSYSPASTHITYGYANLAFPFALTSITDELSNIRSAWTYDAYGRATSSQLGGTSLTSLLGANATGFSYGTARVSYTT